MTDFRERYKRLGFDPDANRALRTQRRDEARRGHRDEQMSLRRDMGATNEAADDSLILDEDTTESTQQSGFSSQDSASCKRADSQEDSHNKIKAAADHEAAIQERWKRLQKWQEDKKKRKQLEKKKAKPVFKVGVVHHRVYSPPVKEAAAAPPPPKLCKSRDMSANLSQTAPKRVTRATEKRLAVKNIVNQQKRENVRSKKAKAQVHNPTNHEDKQVKIAPQDHLFRAPVGVTPMPIFGRQALEATKENIKAELSSFHIPAVPIAAAAFSESFNESLLLKMSSDDQEMLDDSVPKVAIKEAKSPVTRRSSSKNLSPPAADEANIQGVISTDQEMMEVEQFSKTGSFSVPKSPDKDDNISLKKETPSRKRKSIADEPKEVAVESPRRTRSTRAADRRRSIRIASTDSADSGIEPSMNESATSGHRSTKVAASASIDLDTDSIVNADAEVKSSTSKRKSETASKRRSTKLNKEEDTFAIPAAAGRRRSTRLISDTLTSGSIVTIADIHQSPLANQESNISVKSPLKKKSTRFTTTADQENLDFENTNLMDFTFSAPPKPPKVADGPKSLLDDTVMNLTPRRSSRLPPTTGNPEEDQPLIRFSSFYVPTPAINESSSSEPTKPHSPNEIMSLSLNMSLPKESEEEKPPAYFSPYIVQSRGKNSARKEIQKRRFSKPGVVDGDIPTKDNIMQKLNISVEEEERTSQYYKHILNKEIERLNEVCDRWNVIKEDPETPEEIRYIIQAACGQTRLLINKKFERFRSLVQDCETGRGEMLVTCKDLQGFWEMMYMEINDCDGRFNKLEEMKANNWVEKEDLAVVKEVAKKKKPVAKKPAAKKPAAAKPSGIRAMIAAARKKKAEAEGVTEGGEETAVEPSEKPAEDSSEAQKPSTPSKASSRRSSTPKTASKWESLLKKVQLSQTRKATTSPLVVMKLAQMVKTPEVHLDDSIVYINSARTPAKSILKKDEVMGSVSKSTNKVFFKQADEVKEFEIRNSFSVDENMSLELVDNIDEVKEPIERRLNFEDDSFVENADGNSTENSVQQRTQFVPILSATSPRKSKATTLTESPMISMSPLSLEDKSPKNKSAKKNKKQISFKETRDESQSKGSSTKKFSAPLTPRPMRGNKEDADEDMSVDRDDDVASEDTPKQNMVKEIYLNEQGVVSERFVPVKKDTPARTNLKRSNSETTRRGRKSNQTPDSDELKNTPATPRLRRRTTNIPEIQAVTPNGTELKLSVESNSSIKKRNKKRTLADVTLTQDNVDVSMEETTTPKLSKRTPKTTKSKSDSKESSTPTPTLKRTRSLKVTNNEENTAKKTASPKLRRTKSLSVKQVDAEDTPKEALKRKSMKKLQENIEPNQQETDQSTKEKLPRTPSFQRKSSKKQLVIIDPSEKVTDVSDTVSDTMTPNTRRKSLRIPRGSIRSEN